MLNHIPDYLPFACLITGRVVRKPMFTRLVEGLIQATIAAGFTLYVGVQILQRDFIHEKEKLEKHIATATAQTEKRDQELIRTRADMKAEIVGSKNEILFRIQGLEDCIRVRTCTK
jgi:hypothetical protein